MSNSADSFARQSIAYICWSVLSKPEWRQGGQLCAAGAASTHQSLCPSLHLQRCASRGDTLLGTGRMAHPSRDIKVQVRHNPCIARRHCSLVSSRYHQCRISHSSRGWCCFQDSSPAPQQGLSPRHCCSLKFPFQTLLLGFVFGFHFAFFPKSLGHAQVNIVVYQQSVLQK